MKKKKKTKNSNVSYIMNTENSNKLIIRVNYINGEVRFSSAAVMITYSYFFTGG